MSLQVVVMARKSSNAREMLQKRVERIQTTQRYHFSVIYTKYRVNVFLVSRRSVRLNCSNTSDVT